MLFLSFLFLPPQNAFLSANSDNYTDWHCSNYPLLDNDGTFYQFNLCGTNGKHLGTEEGQMEPIGGEKGAKGPMEGRMDDQGGGEKDKRAPPPSLFSGLPDLLSLFPPPHQPNVPSPLAHPLPPPLFPLPLIPPSAPPPSPLPSPNQPTSSPSSPLLLPHFHFPKQKNGASADSAGIVEMAEGHFRKRKSDNEAASSAGGGQSPAEQPMRSFPISKAESAAESGRLKEDKWGRTADLVGGWRKRMYKMFKSIRRQKSSERRKGSSGEKGKLAKSEEQTKLVFEGLPSSLIDARKATKLAKLFGVERKKGSEEEEENEEEEGKGNNGKRMKQLDVLELRTDTHRRRAQPAVMKGERGGKRGEEEGQEEAERFEIVYLPALKQRRLWLKEEPNDQVSSAPPLAVVPSPLLPPPPPPPPSSSPLPLPSSSALPNIPPPHLPPLSSASLPPPILPAVPPSAFAPLPLHFPTLIPPLPSLTPLLSPSPIQSAPKMVPQSPESDYLKELENVPEDYVDEQQEQQRIPCLRAHSPPRQPIHQQAQQAECRKQHKDEVQKGGGERERERDGTFWDENREMCNSERLHSLIKQIIVPSDVEQSKRRLQQRAEQQFGVFYNVICGTGFFSYIAHTDEFCLVSVRDVNCYVFSPVCSTQLSLSSGIARERRRKRKKRMYYSARKMRAFLNRN